MSVRRSAKVAALLAGVAAVSTLAAPAASAADVAASPIRWTLCSDPTPMPAPPGAAGTGKACMTFGRNGELGGWTTEQFSSSAPGLWQNCVMGGGLYEIDSAGSQTEVAQFPVNGVDCLNAGLTNGSARAYLPPSFKPQPHSSYFVVLFVLSKYNDNVVFGFNAGQTAMVSFD